MFAIAVATIFVVGIVLGTLGWAIANVWPILIVIVLGGGGAFLYIRNKRAKNAV